MILNVIWLVLSVVLGGLFVTLLNQHQSSIIKLTLAFGGGFLLSIAFIHFVPELYEQGGPEIGFYILGGFLIQLILEFFSGGIEHGHIHVQKQNAIPYALLFSLSVHSFIEGIPLGTDSLFSQAHGSHTHGDNTLLLGIVFHQFPVAIALMTLLINSKLSAKKSWFLLLIFGLMTPAGLWFGNIQESMGNTFDFSIMMAIVVGMFLHISTTIIFETNENHKFNLLKLTAIIVGVVMAIFIH
jgi:zinc transporter ZupT